MSSEVFFFFSCLIDVGSISGLEERSGYILEVEWIGLAVELVVSG